jgi:hypothetical protein
VEQQDRRALPALEGMQAEATDVEEKVLHAPKRSSLTLGAPDATRA